MNKNTNIGVDFFVFYNEKEKKLEIKLESFPISALGKPMRNCKMESKLININIDETKSNKMIEELSIRKIKSEIESFFIDDYIPCVFVAPNSREEKYLKAINFPQERIEYSGSSILYADKNKQHYSIEPHPKQDKNATNNAAKKNMEAYFDIDIHKDPLLKTYYTNLSVYSSSASYYNRQKPVFDVSKIIHATTNDAYIDLANNLVHHVKMCVQKHKKTPTIILPKDCKELKSFLLGKLRVHELDKVCHFREKSMTDTINMKMKAKEKIHSEMEYRYNELSDLNNNIILWTDGTAFDKREVKFFLKKSFVGGGYLIKLKNKEGQEEEISSNRFLTKESNIELSNLGEFIAIIDGLTRVSEMKNEIKGKSISLVLDSDTVFSVLTAAIKNDDSSVPIEYNQFFDEISYLIKSNNFKINPIVMKSHQNQDNHSFSKMHLLTAGNNKVDKKTRKNVTEFIKNINSTPSEVAAPTTLSRNLNKYGGFAHITSKNN